MSIQNTRNITQQYKTNIYHIELDVSGWDTVNIQAIGTVNGTNYIYGTLNDGMSLGSLYPTDNYAADRARDWSAVQAVNLATGSAVSSFTAAGIYSVPVNFPYLKIAGGGDIYALWQSNIKIG